jgi:hypothetical protein
MRSQIFCTKYSTILFDKQLIKIFQNKIFKNLCEKLINRIHNRANFKYFSFEILNEKV